MDTTSNFQSHIGEVFNEPSTIVFQREQGYRQHFFHWHPHYEILLISQGSYKIESSGHVIAGTTPRAIVHFPYSLHNGFAESDPLYERCIITFTKQLVRMFSPAILDLASLHQVNFIMTDPLPQEMEELLDYARKMEEYRENLIMSALLTALILQKILLICDAGRGEIIRGNYSYIQDALHYIAEHLSSPLSAVELAAKFGVCKTKFHRDFRAAAGKSYRQHLTDLRQTYAHQLLESGESIIRTSLECGYCSEAHFIKAFREYWGITPGEFIHQTKEQR
jgi:AraC-like DNA-binding protein